MKEVKDRSTWALTGALVAAVGASLCCILPAIAVGLGVTSLAASEVFSPWRPYLLALTFGLLAAGFYLAYRPPRESCEPGSACERTPLGRWIRVMLWLATGLVIVFAAFPYYAGWMAEGVVTRKGGRQRVPPPAHSHVVLKIEGLDCPVCAAGLQNKLRAVPGVRNAEVNFQDKQASFDYDPGTAAPSRFEKIIAEAGFKVSGVAPERR